jgi:hypothetical protein
MTILDDLAEHARRQHLGPESVSEIERPLCRISRIPPEWCLGCRRGLHKVTLHPLPGAEPEPEEVTDVTDSEPPVTFAPLARHCACGAPLWFSSERISGRCFTCMPKGAER